MQIDQFIDVPNPPDVPGLRFRHFRGESDFPPMTEVLIASWRADDVETVYTPERMASVYIVSEAFDPAKQLILAEVDGKLVAYARTTINPVPDGGRALLQFGYVLPEWRQKGIGTAMMHYVENGMAPAVAGDSHETFAFQALVWDSQTAARQLLESNGYESFAFFAEMVRPDLENVPDHPLPAGIEVRPVKADQLETIYHAEAEAFKGDVIVSSLTLQRFHEEAKTYDPALWQVAWEGDQIVGMVRNFIRHEENEALGRKRGSTEYISVRAPWRGKGIAKALIARSLNILKEAGMDHAALGVNTSNPTGAFQLYEGMGFKVVKSRTMYRKEMRA